ncbi:hypothetical protein [Actinomadura kijaniata]|uniref:hypothetical protein n=1 Tax=Actinomadura kijaniata TaxID=46161 RepID=UPI00082A65A9|nr:hypothetical protein [Actinomadura kijaniata]
MRVRTRPGTIAACAVAMAGLTVVTATPASAAALNVPVYGTSGYLLGRGYFHPGLPGSIEAYDAYCDGDNGVIAALYVIRDGQWTRSALASVRGCGSTNRNSLDDNSPRPGYDEYVRLRVCKLLPDGTWKDCKDHFTYNSDRVT